MPGAFIEYERLIGEPGREVLDLRVGRNGFLPVVRDEPVEQSVDDYLPEQMPLVVHDRPL